MKIYIATDHAGFGLKQQLVAFLREDLQADVHDCGAYALSEEDDYPDFIAEATRKLSIDTQSGIESRAIVLGGSGQGEAMVANRYAGVRCALYYGDRGTQQDVSGNIIDIIASARIHNDANALSLGARFISLEEAKSAVKRFLETPFSGDERHLRRIAKIEKIGR